MCGPITADLIFSRRYFMDVPDDLDVERAVLMLLTCYSMKQLDLG